MNKSKVYVTILFSILLYWSAGQTRTFKVAKAKTSVTGIWHAISLDSADLPAVWWISDSAGFLEFPLHEKVVRGSRYSFNKNVLTIERGSFPGQNRIKFSVVRVGENLKLTLLECICPKKFPLKEIILTRRETIDDLLW